MKKRTITRVLGGLALLCSLLIPTEIKPQDGVMMQGFYWDVVPGGVWYDSLTVYADTLGKLGFDAIWFPPPYKGASGGYDVGYTPYDYYDLGRFDSHGGDQTSGTGEFIPTRYGTVNKLKNAIQAYHNSAVKVYADIVLNHRSGGILESNQYAHFGYMPVDPSSGGTWTSFPMTNGSERIAWTDGDEFFYPNGSNNPGNTGDFGSPQYDYFQFYTNSFAYDNALHDGYGDNLPFGDSLLAWGSWLTGELNLDGYRFDFVKGIHPNYLKRWCSYMAMNGKFYVGELYDGDIGRLKNWLDWMSGAYTGPGAHFTPGTTHQPAVFDFNLRFAYKDLSDQGTSYDIRQWHSKGLFNNGVPAERIVTFVENHDFDRNDYTGSATASDHNPIISNKMTAYAHMLMSPGLATVWWRDFFYYGLRNQITQLIKIRKAFASGAQYQPTAFTDASGQYQAPYWPGNQSEDPRHVLVLQRMGNTAEQGVLLAINKHPSYNIDLWVTSQKWHGMQLYDITGNSSDMPFVNNDGRVLLKTKASSYSVYVPLSYTLGFPYKSGHFPENSVGYADGTQPRGYTAPPGYLQTAAVMDARNKTIYPGDASDLFVVFKFDTYNKKVYLVFTDDGSIPAKSNGEVVEAVFSKYSGADRYFYATIPASFNQPDALIKYVFYISDGTLHDAFGRVAGTEGLSSQYQQSWTEGDNYFAYTCASVPLPVELSSFTAIAADGGIELRWTTQTELNCYGYVVQRKLLNSDGKWENIGFVQGSGNSSSPAGYQLYDTKTLPNASYRYRLKIIDNDGFCSYSEEIQLSTAAVNSLKLYPGYPNPFNASSRIRYTLPEEARVVLEVFDVLGRRVEVITDSRQKAGEYTAEWNAQNTAGGTYICRMTVISASGTKQISRKLVLLK